MCCLFLEEKKERDHQLIKTYKERRRVFWGAFCIDSHAAISTGWPILIDPAEVTTHLPSSEEAFNTCTEEKTCRLNDVFTGTPYSSFAAAGIVCHVFNRIMKHVHHPRPDDRPEDFEYGPYWARHRELDNMISSFFMFLPERFRLPNNVRDPVAVHTNLNMHASVICLHNSAYEMAEEHNFSESYKQTLRARLQSTATEIVSIVRMTATQQHGYVSAQLGPFLDSHQMADNNWQPTVEKSSCCARPLRGEFRLHRPG